MTRRKIYIVFISMLMISSICVSATNVNFKEKNTPATMFLSNNGGAELPVWENGDSWTYKIELEGDFDAYEASFDITFPSLQFQVVDTSGETYKLSFSGSLTGSGTYDPLGISGQFSNTNINGNIFVNKTDLGNVKITNAEITGKIAAIINLDIDIDLLEFLPILVNMQFPMDVGDSWIVPHTTMVVEGEIIKPTAAASEISMELDLREHNAQCSKKETKNGYADSYKVSTGLINYWYSEDAGNLVWAEKSGNIRLYLYDLEDYYLDITHFKIELKDTNYEPPNELPDNPNKPTGPTSGRAGPQYTYCASGGDDPDGHQVKYGFDWNDDGTVDDWTDFVDSGQQACIDHSFSSGGTYHIKAKTKDEKGGTSEWSPELTVTMAPNDPPGKPGTPSGNDNGIVGTSYPYSTNAVSDPDGDSVLYQFDWGDGEKSNWKQNPEASHKWTTKGTFNVKARSKDEYGATSDWSGGLSVFMDNTEPVKPDAPTGPETPGKDKQVTYKATTTDPEGHQILYKFDWGDGSQSDWVGPFASGAEGSAQHKWTSKNSFEIKVKAKDEYGMETEWSDPMTITVPRVRAVPFTIFNRLVERFPNLLQLIQQFLNL
jgi:hypothetical protein